MRRARNIEGRTEAGNVNIEGGAAAVTRRAWLGGAVAMVGAGAVFMMPMRASAKAKQDVAKYQDSPKDNHKCSGCSQFEAPSACKVVEGTISPEGWCQLFAPKAA